MRQRLAKEHKEHHEKKKVEAKEHHERKKVEEHHKKKHAEKKAKEAAKIAKKPAVNETAPVEEPAAPPATNETAPPPPPPPPQTNQTEAPAANETAPPATNGSAPATNETGPPPPPANGTDDVLPDNQTLPITPQKIDKESNFTHHAKKPAALTKPIDKKDEGKDQGVTYWMGKDAKILDKNALPGFRTKQLGVFGKYLALDANKETAKMTRGSRNIRRVASWLHSRT